MNLFKLNNLSLDHILVLYDILLCVEEQGTGRERDQDNKEKCKTKGVWGSYTMNQQGGGSIEKINSQV